MEMDKTMLEQIGRLDENKQKRAISALRLLNTANICEFIGLGKMEGRHEYEVAYSTLKDIGIDTGTMPAPVEET